MNYKNGQGLKLCPLFYRNYALVAEILGLIMTAGIRGDERDEPRRTCRFKFSVINFVGQTFPEPGHYRVFPKADYGKCLGLGEKPQPRSNTLRIPVFSIARLIAL